MLLATTRSVKCATVPHKHSLNILAVDLNDAIFVKRARNLDHYKYFAVILQSIWTNNYVICHKWIENILLKSQEKQQFYFSHLYWKLS